MMRGEAYGAGDARRSQKIVSLSVALAVTALCLHGSAATAQTINWPSEGPPRPLPARAVNFPPYQLQTRPTACRSWSLHHEQPAVSMRLLIRPAAPDRRELGVAHLTAALLDRERRPSPPVS
jgi:hypothetical protein